MDAQILVFLQVNVPHQQQGQGTQCMNLEKQLTLECNDQKMTSSSECFKWLSKNATTYGFKNLKSEPWHWSTTGH